MTEIILQDVIKTQLRTVKMDHSGVAETWKSLPNTKCQVGYDGLNSLVRIPSDATEATNWKTRNSLIRTRVSVSKDTYLYLSFDYQNSDIIAPFLVDLFSSVDDSGNKSSQTLEELLRRWSGYWIETKPNFSKEDQIGTLGELLILENLLNLKPTKETLEVWSSPKMKDDLHYFEGMKGNIEAKTSSSVPRQFYVSSINQMDHEIIEPKSLTIIFVKLTPGDDFTLPSVVDRIRSKCSEIGISVDFDEMLKKRGYRNFEEDVYAELSFQMDGIDQHIVDSDTPIYTNRELNQIYPAVARINQVVDPNMIDFSTIESSDWSDIANRLGV